MQIVCRKCDLLKDETEFARADWRANKAKQRLRAPIRNYRNAWCKPCKKLYDQERAKDPIVKARTQECKAALYQAEYPRYWAKRQAARARKYGVHGLVTWEEWQTLLAEHHNKCHWCHRDLHVSFLTLDHVVPLAEGGKHDKTNVVPSCANCNHVRLWEMKVKYDIPERDGVLTTVRAHIV